MSGLSVVDGPAVHAIRKGLFEVGNGGSAYSDLDELPLVNKYLEVVFASFREYFCAHGGLKAVALGGLGPEALGI